MSDPNVNYGYINLTANPPTHELDQKRRKLNQCFGGLTDDIIEELISSLPLINKLHLRSVSKQLKSCVDQLLAKEETIVFVNTYGQSCDVFTGDHKNAIDVNAIGKHFNDKNDHLIQLLAKCPQLRRIHVLNNIRIGNEMLEWLANRCPQLDSLSLVDYRCDYHTFDWIRFGDTFATRLVSLEIECRLNQHISAPRLSQLVAKLVNLRELKIVCPQRGLEQVFANLPPNLVRLEIKYCMGLYSHEMKALIDGNGKGLQELVIHYQTAGKTIDQISAFALICTSLLNLKTLSFNHSSLSPQALALVSNLPKLEKLSLNFNGIIDIRHCPHYRYKELDFRPFSQQMPSLLSLRITQSSVDAMSAAIWVALFPNLRHLCLMTHFKCKCQPFVKNIYCYSCIHSCFQSLSNIRTLRSIDFANPEVIKYYNFIERLDQIDSFAANMSYLMNRRSVLEVIGITERIALKRPNRVLNVRLYHIKCGQHVEALLSKRTIPRNLRFTFHSE